MGVDEYRTLFEPKFCAQSDPRVVSMVLVERVGVGNIMGDVMLNIERRVQSDQDAGMTTHVSAESWRVGG